MKRKGFFLFGAIVSIIIFIMFYSFIWYTFGKYNYQGGIDIMILWAIYFLLVSLVTISQYRYPYHELKKAFISVCLYGVPLLILAILEIIDIITGSFSFTKDGFSIVFVSLWLLNFCNYTISVFAKEQIK